MGAVIPDSTEKLVEQIIQQDTIDTIITLYHDRMVTYHDRTYPVTGSHHGNDSVDFNPGQCYKCHEFPPKNGAHIHHVVEKKKECADCHLFTFQCSTYVIANKTFYTHKKQKGLGLASVPLLDPKTHLNGFSGDITFKEKVQNADDPAYDTLFLWDPEKRTCSSSKCHNPVLLGLQHYRQEIWKEVK
jgi:NAD-dependent dihydropyrimidine dehydrogenase PreA subunit